MKLISSAKRDSMMGYFKGWQSLRQPETVDRYRERMKGVGVIHENKEMCWSEQERHKVTANLRWKQKVEILRASEF